MDDELLRLECLKMALNESRDSDIGVDIITRAGEIFNFLKGRTVTVGKGGSGGSGSVAGMSNDKLTVRGRGNDQDFKDYIKDKGEKSE